MLIDWPVSFDQYMDRLEQRVATGDVKAGKEYEFLLAELSILEELKGEPLEESSTLKQVRQSRRHRVWRVAHPFSPEVALRLIVWFPPNEADRVVVALFAGNKAQMGDVFYDSVGIRADATIDDWVRQRRQDSERGCDERN